MTDPLPALRRERKRRQDYQLRRLFGTGDQPEPEQTSGDAATDTTALVEGVFERLASRLQPEDDQ